MENSLKMCYSSSMWETLPVEQKAEYKRMILAFASLTEVFAQKAENDEETNSYGPIINSKFQETVFQKAFNASAEDIGNTSYDAAICLKLPENKEIKYLIGIKTFGINSGDQKVAQFKANHNDWAEIINQIENNSKSVKNDKEKIDSVNYDLYKKLALEIANLRNMRIKSSESNLKGFSVKAGDDNVETVYHVLMPSGKGEEPYIFVGETSYDKIKTDSIEILGCTGAKNPTNFKFTDGNHEYKFTPADSQLYMTFHNKEIVKDKWKVVYLDNPYEIFSNIADKLEGVKAEPEQKDKLADIVVEKIKTAPKIEKSFSWLLTNKENEVELFSGFNNFYGVSSKIGIEDRPKKIASIKEKYGNLGDTLINEILPDLEKYFLSNASTTAEKVEKANFRKEIFEKLKGVKNSDFVEESLKLLYRTHQELYIPIPDSRNFHTNNPNFFIQTDKPLFGDKGKLAIIEEERSFDLIFEPSGEKIKAHITQDYGKGLASKDKQTILGKWILQDIFQLKQYEPLTRKRLEEIGLNGLRFYKIEGENAVHIQFIWIDKDDLPLDFINKQ